MYNVLILGSGRSGTSMITGALSEAGYNLGERSNYIRVNKANPKGYFEDYEVNTINEDILKKCYIKIPEKIRRRFFKSQTFYRARWLSVIPMYIPIISDKKIDKRIERIVSNVPFCYKDPRFSYSLPIWEKHLPNDTKRIVVFREPNKTAESIVRECNESEALAFLKMNKTIALKVWRSMYKHILRNYNRSENTGNWCFVHYNQFFTESKIIELEEFTGAKINRSFADRLISRTEISDSLRNKEEKLYMALCKLAKYEKG